MRHTPTLLPLGSSRSRLTNTWSPCSSLHRTSIALLLHVRRSASSTPLPYSLAWWLQVHRWPASSTNSCSLATDVPRPLDPAGYGEDGHECLGGEHAGHRCQNHARQRVPPLPPSPLALLPSLSVTMGFGLAQPIILTMFSRPARHRKGPLVPCSGRRHGMKPRAALGPCRAMSC